MAEPRGMGRGLIAGTEVFADTAGHHFEADIAALAAAGITRGCNPPDNTLFCPDDPVTRGEWAIRIVTLLLMAFGVDWRVGVFTGFLVALSSTAIVLKILGDTGETNSQPGQASLGLLIFQDLAIVLMVLGRRSECPET